MTPLRDIRIAILIDDLFEQAELTSPEQALEGTGTTVSIITPKGPGVTGLHHATRSGTFKVDLTLDQTKANNFDGLMLPGGISNTDTLRVTPAAQAFVKAFGHMQKPIVMICHGPWLVVSADLVHGRMLTSWPTLQDGIRNAGGVWMDREVVTDRNWVSSRKPDDLPAFSHTFIELLTQYARV